MHPRMSTTVVHYYRDSLGAAARVNSTTYVRKDLGLVNAGFKIRRDYIKFLLLCSSLQSYPKWFATPGRADLFPA